MAYTEMHRVNGPLHVESSGIGGFSCSIRSKKGSYAIVAANMEILTELFSALTGRILNTKMVKEVLIVDATKATPLK